MISRWAFTKKGNVYDFQVSLEGKKKIMKLHKVLELNSSLTDISVYSDKNLLLSISKNG